MTSTHVKIIGVGFQLEIKRGISLKLKAYSLHRRLSKIVATSAAFLAFSYRELLTDNAMSRDPYPVSKAVS
jgi:hypothetical protein